MDEFNDIFSNFQTNMKYAASSKDYKGSCAQCNQPVIGQEDCLRAMNKLYHKDHFLCDGCQKSIPLKADFLIHPPSQKAYHADCYEKKFYEECQACHKMISDTKVIHAFGKDTRQHSYHEGCFVCGIEFAETEQGQSGTATVADDSSAKRPEGCGSAIGKQDANNQKYLIMNSRVYCETCFENNFVPQCTDCSRKIKDSLSPHVENLDDQGNVKKIRYFAYEGKPYCSECYEQKYVPTCHRCQKKIKREDSPDGSYVSANAAKYHKKCFGCYECGKLFEDNKALIHGNELYCREHYDARSKQGKQASAEKDQATAVLL